MAASGGTDDPVVDASLVEVLNPPNRYGRVEALLRTVPQEFEFFQAVRLFERVFPSRVPVGRFASPSAEVLRFGAHASIPFPASRIQNVDWPQNAPPRMVINFMGLTGPSGLLPLYYTELLVERVRQKDHAMKDFFDLFNHRMISLFYQAWEKYRFTISYERGERDRFSHHLMDLVGLGTKGLENRLKIPDDSLLFYAGLLSLHPRSSAALQRILWDYFDVPVEIEQFVGAWHRLESSNLCRFEGSSASEQLGGGAIVGDEIWNQQSGVRIKLGPLGLHEYLDFLPSGTAHEPLKSLAKFVARGEIDFQVQLILKKEDVPACELGMGQAGPPRLGWTSWAKTQPLLADASDTIFSI
ncbi:MAG TPA: type VI secretion system baseplate subunit TssG [Bryobacteraceae bacterium]|jgi:type VI secretion system protein ImpH